MTHEFTLTKTTLKNGKFKYVVTNQEGTIVSSRTSTRHYVACTADGYFYFGRLDLIGKGDHGRYQRNAQAVLTWTSEQFAKMTSCTGTLESWKETAKRNLVKYNEIAYLQQ